MELAWQPREVPRRLLDGVAARRPRERELSLRYLRTASTEALASARTRERRPEVREVLQVTE